MRIINLKKLQREKLLEFSQELEVQRLDLNTLKKSMRLKTAILQLILKKVKFGLLDILFHMNHQDIIIM